ncbi:hypothetical protein SDC9_51128 [bioreactor metagenome]|uniref:Uncharacterized protein n=1 Tax=bioreactor metagenome TaxID=1076179 RepID=A0A644WML9_9ZZZZ
MNGRKRKKAPVPKGTGASIFRRVSGADGQHPAEDAEDARPLDRPHGFVEQNHRHACRDQGTCGRDRRRYRYRDNLDCQGENVPPGGEAEDSRCDGGSPDFPGGPQQVEPFFRFFSCPPGPDAPGDREEEQGPPQGDGCGREVVDRQQPFLEHHDGRPAEGGCQGEKKALPRGRFWRGAGCLPASGFQHEKACDHDTRAQDEGKGNRLAEPEKGDGGDEEGVAARGPHRPAHADEFEGLEIAEVSENISHENVEEDEKEQPGRKAPEDEGVRVENAEDQ